MTRTMDLEDLVIHSDYSITGNCVYLEHIILMLIPRILTKLKAPMIHV